MKSQLLILYILFFIKHTFRSKHIAPVLNAFYIRRKWQYDISKKDAILYSIQ